MMSYRARVTPYRTMNRFEADQQNIQINLKYYASKHVSPYFALQNQITEYPANIIVAHSLSQGTIDPNQSKVQPKSPRIEHLSRSYTA